MPTFAGFAALGSLVFAAAGVVALLIVTLRYRANRRTDATSDELDEIPEAAHRVRPFGRAYGIALGCFATAAALGVLGVAQRSPGSADRLVERIQALEERLTAAEVELETREVASAALAAIDRRSAATNDDAAKRERFPRQVRDADALTPSVAKRPHRSSAAATMQKPAVSRAADNARRPAGPPQPVENPSPIAPQPPGAAPSALADTSATSVTPSLAAPLSAPVSPAPPPPVVSAPLAPVAAAPPLAERDARRPGTPPDSSPPTLAEKVRSDWEAIKRAAREGGDDWVDGWRRLRRVFSD